ncbi:hypothetical protein Tco_1111737 [Tanacetum coccineum]|uniref:Uncharacterized protein n=1 Tax=Tanacetum coccineum TaxID=301880 RepID=A0ABQ5IMV0_9ASTR
MLVMILVIILNLEGIGYTKETTRIEYEWEPPRCNACLIFGHSLDCLKDALKRVENRMNKGKGTPPRAGTNKASTSGHNEESPSNKGNDSFSISNSFEALINPIIEEVATGSKILEGKLALVDDDGKPLENVDYPDNSDNDDEVEHVQNETASFLALKGVRHDRKACGNNGGIQH